MNKFFAMFLVLLFSFLSGGCLLVDPLKVPFQTYTPLDLSDGWTIAEPAEVNIDGDALKNVYQYVHEDNDLWQIRSLLVFKDNKLVAESYMKDSGDRTNQVAIWSCTKQVTAILAGIAADKGLISLSDRISDHLPQVSATQHSNKSQITIENLLTMKSGINFSNDGVSSESAAFGFRKPSNSLDFVLDLGMRSSPGTSFHYNDGDPQIISAILQERTGKTMRDWAKEVLFEKIGINRLEWIIYKDGITMGAFGILTTPRELAKVGQLVINNGQWQSEQIVSNGWLTEMTATKVSDSEIDNDGIGFGYYWWVDNKRNVLLMQGHGGQYLFLNKAKKLIVVITSEPNTQDKFQLSLSKGLSIYDRINSITTE